MRVVTFEEAALGIQAGNIGVVPTDTLYGVVGSALRKDVVERIYAVRGRDADKPCIILLAHAEDVQKFEIVPAEDVQKMIDRYWPGAVSIVLPCDDERFAYLHRGKKSLAFRVPDPKHTELVAFLEKTGPVVAPSANRQGKEPAVTLVQAQEYFGHEIDVYVDGGLCQGEPSTVISFESGSVNVLREGAVKIGI
jgi:L-threonylcarbamoyladenylate synthase